MGLAISYQVSARETVLKLVLKRSGRCIGCKEGSEKVEIAGWLVFAVCETDPRTSLDIIVLDSIIALVASS
jgi:hypothetical protein